MLPYTQVAPYFGQWGEDRWLVEHLRVPALGVFVDIGAGDGVRGSNSRYFEDAGWTGLCVDPDPRNQAALARRRCSVRTCAVADSAGRRDFSMFDAKPSWSGLGERGEGYTLTTVECCTLDGLLGEAGIERIDLLSIDVEGNELDVWASFDADRHQPGIVIVEYDDDRPERTARRIREVLGTERYELRHRTPANLILRGRDAESQRRWPDAR
ncbi:FkbM family methyltransferase [Micromonospora sp. NPDC000663]|uniref:FkbM family methyltransferase n=1 Tax=Micromonospora sp. NPDC000663 TaxID=3364218 RepID=UPI0036BC7D35